MENALMIDWESEKNEVLLNPRMPEETQKNLLKTISLLNSLKSHIFFATSGSSGKLKWTALSKSAILTSAKAVNTHLGSDSSDIWLNPLPIFHVGGMGIIARGYLSKAAVVPCRFLSSKWSPEQFIIQIQESRATLTSLVPTQVFDLVSLGCKSPSSLRAVVVGGGVISDKLYFAALNLGWRILPSYGLTECASQVATAEYGSWNADQYPLLKPLEHIAITLDEFGFLKIKSESLLTAYVDFSSASFMLTDPKIEGWLITEDKGIFEGDFLKSISRGENFIKIAGESVDLFRLEKILEEEKLALNLTEDTALVALEDARLGHSIHLAVASLIHDNIKKLVERYQLRVFPFERINKIIRVDEIPKSPLNKILKSELKNKLQ